MRRIAALLVLLGALALPGSANATYPGDNGQIAFVNGGDIWTMDADGSNLTNLTNTPTITEYEPAWSPDGSKIAFRAVSNSIGKKIFVMNFDGTNVTQVTTGPTAEWDPTWSPDGQRIAFISISSGVIDVVNADGSNRQRFTSGGHFETIEWSPDGSKIVFSFNCLAGGSGHFIGTIDAVIGSGTNPITPVSNPGGCDAGGGSHNIPFHDRNPSWAPDGFRILFDRVAANSPTTPGLYTINSDGTDTQLLRSGTDTGDGAWSPDAAKIAYVVGGPFVADPRIHVMNSDNTGDVDVAQGRDPDWQPIPGSGIRADVLVSLTDAPDPVRAGDELHYTATVKNVIGPNDATGTTLTVNLPNAFFVSATPTQGSCSEASGVVTCNLGTMPKGSTATVDVDVIPRPVNFNTQINASASVSATEPDPIPANNSSSQTTTVTPGGYPRPQGASPLRVSLVPAFKQCGSGDATLTHGTPLSYPSCGNPQLTSGWLTVGTPDANGQGANFIGSVTYTSLFEGPPINPNNGDQSDVKLDVSLADVRNKSDLTDYTGELQVDSALRITDHDNGAGDFTSATLGDRFLDFTVPCTATGSTSTGSTCTLHSSVDAITPGVVKELKRGIWQLGQVRVLDGGPDGDVDTANNTLFAVQGVFIP